MKNYITSYTPSETTALESAIKLSQNIVMKSYHHDLTKLDLVDYPVTRNTMSVYHSALLYNVKKLTYDDVENNIQKLTNVYASAAAIGANVCIIFDSDGKTVNMYIGVCNDNIKTLTMKSQALLNSLRGNFYGSKIEIDPSIDRQDYMESIIHNCFQGKEAVASVSGVASIRNDQPVNNAEFIQGIEKLIDSMHGEAFSAIFLADHIPTTQLTKIKYEYQQLYTSLSPFAKNTLTYNESDADGVSESLSSSLADTFGSSTSAALSIGTNRSNANTDGFSAGHNLSIGVNICDVVNLGGGVFSSTNKSTTQTLGSNESSTTTDSVNSSKTRSTITQTGNTQTHTTGKSLQVTFENKYVCDLLKQIESHLERIEHCQSFGMFASAAYFIAPNRLLAQQAASIYKSIISGKNTALENAAINCWDSSKSTDFTQICHYLMNLKHPEFKLDMHNVTPAALVSSQELAVQMGFPKKSIVGIPVTERIVFGRNIINDNGVSITEDGIHLGALYHGGEADASYPVNLHTDSLTMHTFITGSTGSGKSNTIYQILSKLKEHKATFLIIEPAKGEYKNIFGGRKDVSVYGTNPNLTELLRINPFSFPKGIHIYEHMDRLVEIFNVCWPMYAAMPAVLKDAVERAYQDAGWDLVRSVNLYDDNLFPTFSDVLRQIDTVMNESQYSDENKGDYKGALSTRLRSLTNGINSMIFSSNELSPEDLFDKNVIVDLSRIGSSETKSLIMGLLVMKLQEHRMAHASMNENLKHITVLEEAHNLLKRTSTEQSSESSNLIGKSVEMLTNAIAEMRTYGEGFIIADQAPGLLDISVIRNTNTKIILRLPEHSDRVLVGKAAGLNDSQIDELSRLPKGVAAIYQNDWIEAVLCKVDRYDSSIPYKNIVHPIQNDDIQNKLFECIINKEIRCEGDRNDLLDIYSQVMNSNLPAIIKVDVTKYLNSSEKHEVKRNLEHLVYDFFNGNQAIEKSKSYKQFDDFIKAITTNLEPSVKDLDDNQVILLLSLILQSQARKDRLIENHFNQFVEKYMRSGGVH